VLSWKEDDGDPRRGVPPGTWRWRSTRIERAKDGEPWFLSSCQGRGAEIRLEAGGDPPTRLLAEGKAFLKASAKRDRGAIQVGFDLKDEGGYGISVYRGDRRIEVRWRLLGKDGKEISAGTMNYG
jgi:hypothetical protein